MSEKRKPAGRVIERNCPCCKVQFEARISDVKRGWGVYCSKSCKAVMQTRKTGKRGPYKKHCRHFIGGASMDGK